MNLKEIITEMEIKKEFGEIARFKSGELTYLVKMIKGDVEVITKNGEEKTIPVVVPEIAISLISSQKREGIVTRDYNKEESPVKRKVRDNISKSFSKMYSMLTPEEVDKFKTKDAMPKVLDAIKSYLNKYDSEYIIFEAFKDNRGKRERFYDIALGRLGYAKVLEDSNGWRLYSNKKVVLKKIKNVSNLKQKLTKSLDNMPRAIGTVKSFVNNI